MKKQIILLCYFVGLFIIHSCQSQQEKIMPGKAISIDEMQQKAAVHLANNQASLPAVAPTLDFRVPAKKVMPGVVHIISTYKGREIPQRELEMPDLFRDFFGDDFWKNFESPQQPSRPRRGSGSGVIITDEGYIITNYHVIRNADEIEVILNDNRSYKVEVMGKDPATDLALLKIDEKGLPFVKIGDSDQIEVGEWVLAVGNPFNLSTTVTAGIVSAKARNINIIQAQASIESFIQTDAAVNPGNSGGALVNLQGELVGINTAIASPTGAYAGYSFAIPVNIAKKVVDDLLNFGEVRRAYLGVFIKNIDGKLARELQLENTEGVYLDSILAKSAAAKAGVRAKDVIIKVDGKKVNSAPHFQEIIGRHRPDDQILLTLIRNGKEKEITVRLKGKSEETTIVKKDSHKTLNALGIDIADLSAADLEASEVTGGVKITKIYAGTIQQFTDIRAGFIIARINRQAIKSVKDFIEKLETTDGNLTLEGYYLERPNMIYSYSFGI